MSLTSCVIGKDVMKLPFTKISNATHNLLVNRKEVMRMTFTMCAMSLTSESCWSWEKMWWNCHSETVKYHTLPIGHRKRCNETAFHTMHNVTHTWALSVIGKRCDVTAFHNRCNVAHQLLVIGTWYWQAASHKICNVTHRLLTIGKDVRRHTFTKSPMSLTGTNCWSWEKIWCHYFHKMCNVTHWLFVIGDVMRLHFTKSVLPLTCCGS